MSKFEWIDPQCMTTNIYWKYVWYCIQYICHQTILYRQMICKWLALGTAYSRGFMILWETALSGSPCKCTPYLSPLVGNFDMSAVFMNTNELSEQNSSANLTCMHQGEIMQEWHTDIACNLCIPWTNSCFKKKTLKGWHNWKSDMCNTWRKQSKPSRCYFSWWDTVGLFGFQWMLVL